VWNGGAPRAVDLEDDDIIEIYGQADEGAAGGLDEILVADNRR
jgi:hypothetical protein